MADEQVIKLLEEIRDLQKLHVENYKEAAKIQEQSIQMQKQARGRARWILVLFVLTTLLITWPHLLYLFRFR